MEKNTKKNTNIKKNTNSQRKNSSTIAKKKNAKSNNTKNETVKSNAIKGGTKKKVDATSKAVKKEKEPIIKEEIKDEVKVKNSPSNSKQNVTEDFGGDEIRKLLIIIGVVCTIMLAFYFITDVVVKHKKNSKDVDNKPETKIETEIKYGEILMGNLFKQKEDSYYVLAYEEDDVMNDIYDRYIDTYKKLDNSLKVYKVNLSNSFNKVYVAENSYLEGSNIDLIRVKEPTLIRIEEGAVYLSFEGTDNILGRLKYITEP